MKNQISALSDSFPSLDHLFKKIWFGVRGSWLKYLLLIPLMLLTTPICILPVSQDYYYFITKCMIEAPMKMMTRHEAVDQRYSSIYDQ